MSKAVEKVFLSTDLIETIVDSFSGYCESIIQNLNDDQQSMKEIFRVIHQANGYTTMVDPANAWLNQVFVDSNVANSWSYKIYSGASAWMGNRQFPMRYALPDNEDKKNAIENGVRDIATWCYEPSNILTMAHHFFPTYATLKVALYEALGEPKGGKYQDALRTIIEDYYLEKVGLPREETLEYQSIKETINSLMDNLDIQSLQKKDEVLEEIYQYGACISAQIKRVGNALAETIIVNIDKVSDKEAFDALVENCREVLQAETLLLQSEDENKQEQVEQDKEFVEKNLQIWSQEDEIYKQAQAKKAEQATLTLLQESPDLLETEEDKKALQKLQQRHVPLKLYWRLGIAPPLGIMPSIPVILPMQFLRKEGDFGYNNLLGLNYGAHMPLLITNGAQRVDEQVEEEEYISL